MVSPESLRSPDVYRLVCRPALPKDTPDVLELTRQIWEGHDYVPSVWADWLRDPEGLLASAEYGGRVVGISKLTRLSPSEWWLEGLRVHPEFEGRGIATHLQNYLVNYWQPQGGAIRLATASFRIAVQRISLHSGFSKVAELTQYVSEAITGPGEGFTPVASGEEADALAFALQHPSSTCPNGLMGIGWQWVALSAGWITPAVARGQAWWWRGDKGEPKALLLARVDDDEEEKADRLMIQLLSCQPEKLVLCLKDYRRLAGSLGYKRVSWMAPLDPALEPALLEAGFRREWDESLFIYEKRGKISSPAGDAAFGQAA